MTAPFGAAVLAPLAIALEREQVVHYLLEPRWSGLGGASTAVLVMLGGVAAFAMMLFEFRVVQLASGLTLSIAGVFKEVRIRVRVGVSVKVRVRVRVGVRVRDRVRVRVRVRV